MSRRDFLVLTAAAAVAWPLALRAQQVAPLPRVVYFTVGDALVPEEIDSYAAGLAQRGYFDGKNIALEYVYAPTVADLSAYAARIVTSKPYVVVAWGGAAVGAMQTATTTIPIVFLNIGDPVGVGFVTSLARPGGNLTGNTNAGPEVVMKQVAVLRETVPGIKRFAVLYLPSSPANARNAENVRQAAIAQGIEPVMIGFVEDRDLTPQFERVVSADVQAAFNVGNVYLGAVRNRDLLWELLVKAKIPAIAQDRDRTGAHTFSGVVAYGASDESMRAQAGEYVVQILKGAKPGDLPVQYPKVFELAVDLKAAKLIGITIPPSILAQATLVIE